MWGGRLAVVVVSKSFRSTAFRPFVPATFFTSSSSPLPSKKVSKKMLEGVEMNYDFTSMSGEDIHSMADSLIERYKKIYDNVAGADKVSKETVLDPLLDSDRWSSNEGGLLAFIRNVSKSKEQRDASTEVSEKLDQVSVELSMRVDVFEKLEALEKTEGSKLSGEVKRALEKKVKEGRRNGLHLDESVRTQLKEIKERLSKLSIEFQKNCNEESGVLYFTRDELAGLPEPFLDSLKVGEDGKLQITLKYPHVFPVSMKCRVPETRKQLETKFHSRCAENVPLLEEALELRQKEADLLGYANHAAYMQELLMVKGPANVDKFLTDLRVKLQPLWEKEKEQLLELKRQECEKSGLNFDGKLNAWDTRYYARRLEEEQFSVEKEALKPYFPINVVTEGLLSIYETLLSLRFTPVPNAAVWNEEVTCYKVEDSDTKELMGYFYLDLHPREGKFGHNACMPLQQGCAKSGSCESIPSVVAMVCNFSPPQGNRPALLGHEEVETFFHEFGHVMHCICSRTELTGFSGPHAVERDFVECPSQMLENWVWYADPLKKMSKHYETGEPVPDDIIEKLVASKKANAGGFNTRQVSLALFDQEIHSGGRCDVGEVYARRVKETVGIDVIPGTNMPATFTHVMGGYSARYYSYLWSEVFSADMFETRFGKDRLFCKENGKAYRELILCPGGSVDAADILRKFLGRDPMVEPFLKSKGLSL